MTTAECARQPRQPTPILLLCQRRLARTLGATLLLALATPAWAAPASDIVSLYLDAMSRRDRTAVADVIADDAIFEYPFDKSGRTEAGAWRVFVGREAVLAGYVDTAFRRMAKIGFVDREITRSSDGRRVFVETLGDMDLGGTPYRNRYVLRFDLEGGRITRMKEYMNPVTGAIAAGVATGAEAACKQHLAPPSDRSSRSRTRPGFALEPARRSRLLPVGPGTEIEHSCQSLCH